MITWTKLKDECPAMYKPVLLAGFHGFPQRLKVSSGYWDGKKFVIDNPTFEEEKIELWSTFDEPDQELKIIKKIQYFDHEYDGLS